MLSSVFNAVYLPVVFNSEIKTDNVHHDNRGSVQDSSRAYLIAVYPELMLELVADTHCCSFPHHCVLEKQQGRKAQSFQSPRSDLINT